MSITLAFDVYGTLIDTHDVVSSLSEWLGEDANHFSRIWREKQLEYSFRRGLMQNYVDFSECTRHALDYTCQLFNLNIARENKEKLLESYNKLPVFEDVKDGLEKLRSSGFRLFAFSNGKGETVESLLKHAGIRDYFISVVSAQDLKSYKPNPAVYSHFLRKAEVNNDEAWLISSNSFDVIGALSAGMRAAWVKRSGDAIFDPWEITPTMTVGNLTELYEKLKNEFS